jgi:hypothetical protein
MPQENSLEQRRDDQHLFLQAALLWHTQILYESAHDACRRTGAYDNGDGFLFDVVAVIEHAVKKLKELDEIRPVSTACHENKDCHPPTICSTTGNCVNPFTGEVVRPDRY